MPPSIDDHIAEALPSGEEFRESFLVELTSYNASKKPYAPNEYRPEIFQDLSMPRDRWGGFLGTLYRLFASEDMGPTPVKACDDPALRPKWQKQRRVFWGSWESMAGQMLASMNPRSKAGVNIYLVLTSHTLRTVYLHRRRGSYTKLGGESALGWSCPLTQLAYVRTHPSITGDCFEFGFPDGSWGVLIVHNSKEFKQLFADKLTAGS